MWGTQQADCWATHESYSQSGSCRAQPRATLPANCRCIPASQQQSNAASILLVR